MKYLELLREGLSLHMLMCAAVCPANACMRPMGTEIWGGWGLSAGCGLLWCRSVTGEPADQQEVQVCQSDCPGHRPGAHPRH